MANFCPACGRPVSVGDVFCTSCGARLAATQPQQVQQVQQVQYAQVPAQAQYAQPQQAQYAPVQAQVPYAAAPVAQQNQYVAFAPGAAVRYGTPAPGFSDRVTNPEILAAAKKSRRASKAAIFFVVPLPLIGFAIYSAVTGEMEMPSALTYGAIVSAVFLVFALISLAKNRAEKSYDGTVIDKSKTRTHSEEEGWTTEYTTVVRLTNGRTKKIKETDSNWFKVYDYLEVGDVFRYHPQFAFPYEVYDKSRKQHLYCVGCRAKNPVANDRCSRCNLPLLK